MIAPLFSAVLLAAGKSSRMGQLKAFLPWCGKPLIEYQVSQLLDSELADVIVVLGYKRTLIEDQLNYYPVKTIMNPLYDTGKTSSIKCGLQMVKPNSDGIFILAVDQPVKKQTIKKMIHHFSTGNHSIIIPTFNKKRGHPILFSATLLDDLFNISEDTQGIRSVIKQHADQITELEIEEEEILYNLNTYDEYLSNKK